MLCRASLSILAGLVTAATVTTSAAAETPRPPLKSGEVELSLGKGHFARVTPPSGWSTGTAFGNEKCWNAPRNEGRFCVSTSWIRGRSNEAILEEYLSGIACEKRTDDTANRGPVEAIRRECVVKVGPRKEGRMWYVSRLEGARDAVRMAFHLQRDDKAFVETLTKAANSLTYYSPTESPPTR